MEPHHRKITLLFALGLAACGGGGSGGSNGSTTTFAYSEPDAIVLSGAEIEPLLPYLVFAADSWTISPALPAGLSIDPATGVISGAADAPASRTLYHIEARGDDGRGESTVRLQVVAPQRYAFVSSENDDTLSALAVDAASGHISRATWHASTSIDVGLDAIAIHPDGRSAYLTHQTSSSLVHVEIDPSTGTMTEVGREVIPGGPHQLAIDPTGRFLFMTCFGTFELRRFALDESDGSPTFVGMIILESTPTDLAFDPTGTRLFVTSAGVNGSGQESQLSLWSVNATTGATVQLGETLRLNGSRPVAVAVHPHERLVVMALDEFNGLAVARYDNAGGMVPISPLVPSGDSPSDVAIDPRGRFVWVAAQADDEVRAFELDSDTGALTVLPSTPAGTAPAAVATDALGGHVHVLARGSGELITFAVSSEGWLERERSMIVRAGSSALAFSRGDAPLASEPLHVHVASRGADQVETFSIAADTGLLTPSALSFTGDQPVALDVDEARGRAVVLAQGTNRIEVYAVNALTGALGSAEPAVIVGGALMSTELDASGRFAYAVARDVVNPGDGWLFTIGLYSGEPWLVDARLAGSNSCGLALDPTGEYVYVANQGDGTPGTPTIASFRIDPRTGIPTGAATVAAPGISAIALHPDARSVYAVLAANDALARYSVDRTSGVLTAVLPTTTPEIDPTALIVDPLGRFAYVSYTALVGPGEINALRVAEDGTLGPSMQEVVDGTDPIALAIEPGGRFLYAANIGSHDLSVFAIDAKNGTLTARTPMPTGTEPVGLVATARMQ